MQRHIDHMDGLSRGTAQRVLDDLCARALVPDHTYSSAMAFGLLADWLLPTLEVDWANLIAKHPKAVVHEIVVSMSVGLDLCHTRQPLALFARAVAALIGPLEGNAALDVAIAHDVCDLPVPASRPVRFPHHAITVAAMAAASMKGERIYEY